MSTHDKNPTIAELIERIDQLEQQLAGVVHYQTKRLISVEAKVSEIETVVCNERVNADHRFSELHKIADSVYQYLADIHDYLWPVVHKVFPRTAAGFKQIDSFLKRPDSAVDEKSPVNPLDRRPS